MLNAVKPGQAFEIVLNIAAIGVLAAWATIVLCQLRFYSRMKTGTMQRPNFRMPLAPYSGYVTLVFLAGVLVLMMCDPEKGPWIMATLVAAVPALIGGWFLVRDRVTATAGDVADHASDVADANAGTIETVTISLTYEDKIAVLDLGADENRFSPDFLDEIHGHLDEVVGAGAQGLVTTGGGKFYSNGLDLDWLAANGEQTQWYVGRVQGMLARILTLPVPTAAALVGHAFGAGAMLALAHDFR